ncbi:hypothetical protein FNJ84_05810 [Paracoccus sp. M683]|uniref:hypothetical protein n=1 Tax=Paracoccus sp. M683 TaxID=2594268 RepID=UPI00117DB966|nr:hypothetical protein [Paracoccus sp. M683]TRW98293.1 hypothetical protein FNJ84_05810 [Paracoccus sp. M683]
MVFAIIGALAAAGFWIWRIRMAGEAARELGNMANDVLGAARALGFRRRANTHPADSIDDPELAITATAMAFLELDGLPSREDQQALAQSLTKQLASTRTKIEEMMIVGRWLVNECNGPQPAITRLAKRLARLDRGAFQTLLPVLNDIGQRAGGLSDRQRDALADIARVMKLS